MRKLTNENKLSIKFPIVAKSWHPIKNNDLTPSDVACFSNKKYWWICEKGHEWEASAASRTKSKSNCPYCSGRLLLENKSLRFKRPDVAKSWHPIKNNNLTPNDVTCSSGKKYWWICEKGHEWESSISNRTNRNNNCPYCSGRVPSSNNSLNKEHPIVAKSWHPTKNNDLTPSDVTCFSNKKCWWICEKEHEWKTSVYNRTNGSKCPFCTNQKVCKENCLQNIFPKIAKELHPTKNGSITSKNIIHGSNKKYWWVCKKGHEWKASCYNRTGKNKTGCPYCLNQKVCKDNSLAALFPNIAKELHTTKNKQINPNEILSGSSKKYWWICEKGHEWKTSCCKRTIGGFYKEGTNCPMCKSSIGENKIEDLLKNKKIKYERQVWFNSCRNELPLRFDFKIENVLIEFQGQQHYYPVCFGNMDKNKATENYLKAIKLDEIKKIWCKKNKMKLYTISYLDYHKLEKIINKIIKQHQIQQYI